MERSARRAAVLLAATLGGAAAHAVPVNIGSSGGQTWEQVRFHGPHSAADSIYAAGVTTKVGVVPGDYCSSASVNCGTAMSFATALGGALMLGASDDADGAVNTTLGLALQDLSPAEGGLGVVSRSPTGAVSGDNEINRGDVLTLAFAKTVRLAGLHLGNHNPARAGLNGAAGTFGLAIDGGATQLHTLQSLLWWGGSSSLVGKRFTFSHVDADYRLVAIDIAAAAAVPEPHGLALMLLGLAALGATARRQRPH
jgi:hypothetical protein